MNNYAPSSLLGQARPSDTNNATLYTASLKTEIGRIIIANTSGSAATFRLFHDQGGSTYDESNALAFDVSIATGAINDALQSFQMGNGITLAPTDTLGIRSSVANALTFTIYGVVSDAR
tara:strand:- start:211 stop:567 length:357 start_codon:yes stop_codon:yes gene_type:complete